MIVTVSIGAAGFIDIGSMGVIGVTGIGSTGVIGLAEVDATGAIDRVGTLGTLRYDG